MSQEPGEEDLLGGKEDSTPSARKNTRAPSARSNISPLFENQISSRLSGLLQAFRDQKFKNARDRNLQNLFRGNNTKILKSNIPGKIKNKAK